MNATQLRDCRKRLGMTQAELAQELEISLRRYLYLERGERPIKRYIELACKAIERQTA